MAPKIKHVVADTGAFIRRAPLRDMGENIYTILQVVQESRDRATRQLLSSPTFELKFKEPSPDAIKAVTSFAKLTGDYGFLSVIDLKVLALTYDLEKQFNGTDHIRKEPAKKPEFTGGSYVNSSNESSGSQKRYGDGDTLPSHLIEDLESDGEDAEIQEEQNDCDFIDIDIDEKADDILDRGVGKNEEKTVSSDSDIEEKSEDTSEASEDEDEGWITPSNIADVKRSFGVNTDVETGEVSVGCLTTDFAMQNVLIQMGLNVLSVDGMLIKHVKTYVLRCYGCGKITKDTSKKFCPHCGNQTLKRLSTSVDENGCVKYYLAKNYTIRTRGKKYSLPKPQGGKHASNPILTADQPFPHQRPSKKGLQKVDILSGDFVSDSSPFKVNDVTSRAAQLGRFSRQAPQWTKRNPNESKKKTNKRKK